MAVGASNPTEEDESLVHAVASLSFRPALNNDVLDIIFDHIIPYIPSDSVLFLWETQYFELPNRKFLSPLCLVCRQWLVPARRILYKIVILSSTNSRKFAATIMGLPQVQNHVLRIYYHLDETSYYTVFKISKVLPRCMLYITSISEPLKVLHHGSRDLVKMDNLEGIFLDKVEWPVDIWNQAFLSFARLRHLRFRGPHTFKEFPAQQMKRGLLPCLRVLEISELRTLWIAPPTCPNTLHTLVLKDCSGLSKSVFLRMLARHSVSLRRITIDAIRFDDLYTKIFDEIGLRCPKLEYVEITRTRHMSDKVISDLPPSVIHVALAFNTSLAAEHLLIEKIIKFFQERLDSAATKPTPLKKFEINNYGGSISADQQIPGELYEGWVKADVLASKLKVEFNCRGGSLSVDTRFMRRKHEEGCKQLGRSIVYGGIHK
jgi:hypothetical protein